METTKPILMKFGTCIQYNYFRSKNFVTTIYFLTHDAEKVIHFKIINTY